MVPAELLRAFYFQWQNEKSIVGHFQYLNFRDLWIYEYKRLECTFFWWLVFSALSISSRQSVQSTGISKVHCAKMHATELYLTAWQQNRSSALGQM